MFVSSLAVFLQLGVVFTSRPSHCGGRLLAIGLIVGLMAGVAVPGILRRQEAEMARMLVRDRDVGYARRMQYL
ncbi:hypothetical protein RA276_30925, partial [Pseudomonas syringae pv. tagetis]